MLVHQNSHAAILRALDVEQRKEALRRQAHDEEAARHRGARWSGFQPDPFVPADEAELRERAELRVMRDEAWRNTPTRKLLRAVSDVAYSLEEIRALVSRAGVPESLGQADKEKVSQIIAQIKAYVTEAEEAVWS